MIARLHSREACQGSYAWSENKKSTQDETTGQVGSGGYENGPVSSGAWSRAGERCGTGEDMGSFPNKMIALVKG